MPSKREIWFRGRRLKKFIGVKNSYEKQFNEVVFEAQQLGYKIKPSALQKIKKDTARAQYKKLLTADIDAAICATALLSAAMHNASLNKTKTIVASDVREGWEDYLSAGPGNCPPHICARRSIIERVSEVKETLPEFGKLMNILQK